MPDPTNRLVAIRTADAEVADPCPCCGSRGRLFWIRSHVQCGEGGQVVEGCCEGPAGCT